MDSSGFSSPRPDCFPAGLRVLVVDDDPTWLKILEKMLKKCNYEVRTCNLARDALDLLRERKDGYDIVISDVNMPDMDGFKLLEHVGLEMDLPVIMMSVDGETSRVMKGVQHGACDYLLKPIRMKELRNIWQHVFRKRIRDIEGHESLEEIQMMRNAAELSDDGFFFGPGKKRKDLDNDRVCGGDSSAKKARVVWTVDLHQKFVKAVNLIGFEKVGPKKILDLMGVPWLTRENVASHLQKYRLYLSRLQKENELKATLGNVCSKISTPIAHEETKICEAKVKSNLDSKDLAKSSSSSISFDHSFRPLTSDAKSEPKIQIQYPWSAGAPFKPEQTQFKKDEKVTKVETAAALFSIQPQTHSSAIDPITSSISNQNLFDEQESWSRNAVVGSGSALRLWEGELYSPQNYTYPQNLDPFGFGAQDLPPDVSSHLYDSMKFPIDAVEYPVIDQGVYIA